MNPGTFIVVLLIMAAGAVLSVGIVIWITITKATSSCGRYVPAGLSVIVAGILVCGCVLLSPAINMLRQNMTRMTFVHNELNSLFRSGKPLPQIASQLTTWDQDASAIMWYLPSKQEGAIVAVELMPTNGKYWYIRLGGHMDQASAEELQGLLGKDNAKRRLNQEPEWLGAN